MTTEIRAHWTDDDELLARFVLERVSPGERTGLEAHLVGCERCRAKVANERLIAAGVRKLGRAELKRSLADRLHTNPSISTPWTRILAAAAVIVIAGGMAILGRWIFVKENAIPDFADSLGGSTAVAPTVPSEAPAVEEGKTAERDATEKERTMGRIVEKQKGAKDIGRAEAAAPRTTPPGKAGGDEVDEWWVGRHVILGGPGDSIMADMNPAASAENRPAGKSGFRGRKAGKIVLAQRPLHELPLQRRKPDGRANGSEVEIRVGRQGERIVLTLYVDPLFEPSLLEKADIQEVGSDSLLVTVGDQVIGIRVPGGLEKAEVPGSKRQ